MVLMRRGLSSDERPRVPLGFSEFIREFIANSWSVKPQDGSNFVETLEQLRGNDCQIMPDSASGYVSADESQIGYSRNAARTS
jgi:hypothetical protein